MNSTVRLELEYRVYNRQLPGVGDSWEGSVLPKLETAFPGRIAGLDEDEDLYFPVDPNKLAEYESKGYLISGGGPMFKPQISLKCHKCSIDIDGLDVQSVIERVQGFARFAVIKTVRVYLTDVFAV